MKIVTMCGCGLGTCLVLKYTAQKALEELGVEATIVPCSIDNCMFEKADLYLVPYGLVIPITPRGTMIAYIQNVLNVSEVIGAIQNVLQNQQ